MEISQILERIKNSPDYSGQIVHIHEEPARQAIISDDPVPPSMEKLLDKIGIGSLYCHQAEAIHRINDGQDVVIATGTGSGKTLCYLLPILDRLSKHPNSKALLLFPTKALCQDQFRNFVRKLGSAGLETSCGVFDGDTPSSLRRKLRDRASVIFSNPDMIHTSLLPQHARWADFLSDLDLLVLDELHTYNGIFGSNMAHLIKRLLRICAHYGSSPQVIACSATIANPRELAEKLTGRRTHLIDRDGSPRGRRIYVFWNPPRVRATDWRSRRSANVEAHELMAELVASRIPTITFSKAKMTAELIHRYVTEKLRETAPQLASKVMPYRGGYLPEERREIELRLFNGELLGVSTTPALELGIDVGNLGAAILVGYPGTRASFYQQSGRAGRKDADSIVFLIGLDTSVNQYIMSRPEYIFEKPIEQAVIDPDNPFVLIGHLRCAAYEIPISENEIANFGEHAEMVLELLQTNKKVKKISGKWYYSSSETPNYEISLRSYADANVTIQDSSTGAVLGEVNRYDSQPILHPEAIYMHLGDTYRVLDLDLDRNIATVERADVDYYTQPIGGTDIHHIDNQLREKEFGTGKAYWGEVTAYYNTYAYEKIHFYSLDAISVHGVDLPNMVLETMAFWMVPPEGLMEEVRRRGLDVHSGLRGIGYATRMILPLFITCDTLDFSHTIGSVNSPWNAIFIYERYPHGLGFTEKAYTRLHEIMPVVLENIRSCSCRDGCPCCVGKPLRRFTTWNVERGEASIPSKKAAVAILEGYLDDFSNLDNDDLISMAGSDYGRKQRLEMALRRRLERMREPQVFHPIKPMAEIETEYPEPEDVGELKKPDVIGRRERRQNFEREFRKRLTKRLDDRNLPHGKSQSGIPRQGGNLPPTAFPGAPLKEEAEQQTSDRKPVILGDSLAARARKLRKNKNKIG